jgi:cobalt-zinc-cadmium efflux system membrane fusion protein
LIGLLSFDLAEAKSLYEIARNRWQRDKRKILAEKRRVARSQTLPGQAPTEAEVEETESRSKMNLARDKLRFYGLTEDQIDNIEKEDDQRKSRLTLRSPIDGTVVQRAAVLGNRYDRNDVLLVIRPSSADWDSIGRTH